MLPMIQERADRPNWPIRSEQSALAVKQKQLALMPTALF